MRDKIFALYSVAKRLNVSLPELEYSKSAAFVFTKTTSFYIEASGSLELFLRVNYGDSISDLLSWLPDWSHDSPRGPAIISDGARASKLSSWIPEFTDQYRQIRLKVHLVGSI